MKIKKWIVSTETHTVDEVKEALGRPGNVINKLSISQYNPKAVNCESVTSEGWKNDLIDSLWKEAKRSNAQFAAMTLCEAKTAENWSCRVTVWHPEHFKGWRKYTWKLCRWLEDL